jgi:hypothetical protein
MMDRRRDLGFRLLVALNVGIAIAYIGLWFIALDQNLTWRADFTAFYTAARMVRAGVGQRLYDFELQTVYQRQILDGLYLADGLMAFYYPPYVALLLTPLSFLSRRSAYIVWSLAQALLLCVILKRLWKFTCSMGWSSKARIGLLSVVVALPPMMLTFLLGTFSLLIFLCIFEFCVSLSKGSKVTAGLWMSLGLLKPQAMLFPGLLLLVFGYWRSVFIVLGVIGLAALISTLTLDLLVWPKFLGAVGAAFNSSDALGVKPSAMRNLKGLLASIFPDMPLSVLNWISLSGLILSVLLVLWFGLSKNKIVQRFDFTMATVLLCGMAFVPHLNPQDGLFVIVPWIWLYQGLREQKRDTLLLSWIALLSPVSVLVFDYVLHVPIPLGSLMIVGSVILGTNVWLRKKWIYEDK